MSSPEFSRLIKVKPLPAAPVVLEASESERAALAKRFGLPAIASLTAEIDLSQDGKTVRADGEMQAEITQTCAVSGEDFAVFIEEEVGFRFVEESQLDREPAVEEGDPGSVSGAGIEIELSADELDEIGYSGDSFDLGEAVAQSLGLAIDPYAEGPNADAARKDAGISSDDGPSGPLAEALAALKKN